MDPFAQTRGFEASSSEYLTHGQEFVGEVNEGRTRWKKLPLSSRDNQYGGDGGDAIR